MDTLVAPLPSTPLDSNIEPRRIGASFGDGYGQMAPDGINSALETVQVTWNLLEPSEALALMNFFRSQLGTKVFFWTKPYDTVRKWRCSKWNRVDDKTTATVTATFEEQP